MIFRELERAADGVPRDTGNGDYGAHLSFEVPEFPVSTPRRGYFLGGAQAGQGAQPLPQFRIPHSEFRINKKRRAVFCGAARGLFVYPAGVLDPSGRVAAARRDMVRPVDKPALVVVDVLAADLHGVAGSEVVEARREVHVVDD